MLRFTAKPCDESGEFLPFGAPPPEDDDSDHSWAPFNDRPSFHFARFAYTKSQLSGGDVDELLEIWAAHNLLNGGGDAPFRDQDELCAVIDSIPHGDAPWETFSLRYDGPLDESAPSWKHATYQVHCRNTRVVAHNMLSSVDFDGKFDYTAYQEYMEGSEERRYSNVMSGDWAFKKSVCFIQILM